MIIHARAYPRVGLVGNPSDGYFGKTIALVFRNFQAEVLLYETPELEILPAQRDRSVFQSVDALAEDVCKYGYYGGIRLVKAAIKRFRDHCRENGLSLSGANFTIRYRTNIPHHVGLGGSSAIITACFRALMRFHEVQIEPPVLANLILSVEQDELGIRAGLQDRVVQVYEGLVYMDFDRELMARRGYGRYEYLPARTLPHLYVAYRTDLAEGSEVFHNNIRERFDRGERPVVEAMRYWARLTDRARTALEAGDKDRLGSLLDANFNRRRKIYHLSEANRAMVETARNAGASAKFAGSGGAIVGTYADQGMYTRLKAALRGCKVRVFKPRLVAPARSTKETP